MCPHAQTPAAFSRWWSAPRSSHSTLGNRHQACHRDNTPGEVSHMTHKILAMWLAACISQHLYCCTQQFLTQFQMPSVWDRLHNIGSIIYLCIGSVSAQGPYCMHCKRGFVILTIVFHTRIATVDMVLWDDTRIVPCDCQLWAIQ